jgi:hypothetical protein
MNPMVTFVVWVLASLLLAVVVFVVAAVMQHVESRDDAAPGGLGGFWRSFRAGLRRPRGRRDDVPEPVEVGMDSFFAATIEDAPGYVDAGELGDVLQRVRVQARTSLHVGTVVKPGRASDAAGAAAGR